MGILVDNQKALAELTEQYRALDERVARIEALIAMSWWDRVVKWFKELL